MAAAPHVHVHATRLVLVESPYAAKDNDTKTLHEMYAAFALRDCLRRGEAPFASHVLYAAMGLLDDNIPEERAFGIEAGLAWGAKAHVTALYVDLGISPGMRLGIERALQQGRPVERRNGLRGFEDGGAWMLGKIRETGFGGVLRDYATGVF